VLANDPAVEASRVEYDSTAYHEAEAVAAWNKNLDWFRTHPK